MPQHFFIFDYKYTKRPHYPKGKRGLLFCIMRFLTKITSNIFMLLVGERPYEPQQH